MTRVESGTLYGTLNLLILKILQRGGPRHGLGVAREIEATAGDVLRIEEGALYPALHRLEEAGYLEADWGQSENNRRARFYRLTADGRAFLRREEERWVEHARAVSRVLQVALEG